MTKAPEEGKGVLFSSDKRGNERAPDFKGQVMVDGKIIKLSAWKRMSAYGELISLSVNQFSNQQNQYPKEINRKDQDVPF